MNKDSYPVYRIRTLFAGSTVGRTPDSFYPAEFSCMLPACSACGFVGVHVVNPWREQLDCAKGYMISDLRGSKMLMNGVPSDLVLFEFTVQCAAANSKSLSSQFLIPSASFKNLTEQCFFIFQNGAV